MYYFRNFVANYLTGLLSVLLVLNLIIIAFSAMGLGLDQLRLIPAYVTSVLDDTSHYLSRDSDSNQLSRTSRSSTTTATKTAGVISNSNIQLVSSQESFAVAVSKTRASVVNISCEQIASSTDSSAALKFDDPAQDLAAFGGIGSGIIVDSRGYILTCYHIVARASNIIVTPFGNKLRRYRAQIVAKDMSVNLALLRIYAAELLIAAPLGDSSRMEVADSVLAIGNPFGLEQSVTHGIISDNRRDLLIQGVVIKNMMQTDVPINRGSSGGPLINISGEIVGINMAIYSPTGVYIGISFALPVNQAKLLLAKAIQDAAI